MNDYKKINVSHHLSSFDVQLPVWHGSKNIRKPFEMWRSDARLPWYQAYNETKHDRHTGFAKATLDHLIDAVCGVLTMLCAQFATAQYDYLMTVGFPPDGGFQVVIGRYFTVRFPDDWPEEERYDFSTGEWHQMKDEDDPFQNFRYT